MTKILKNGPLPIKKEPFTLRRISVYLLPLCFLVSCSFPLVKETNLFQAEANPIKLVQLSDIHFKSGQAIFTTMVQKVNALEPDIIVFTGDMIENTATIDAFFACIAGITVDCPKFAILGNWEYAAAVNVQALRIRLQDHGIQLLLNESSRIAIHGRSLTVSGLDDFLGGHPNLTSCLFDNDGINLVLAHCPILFDSVRATKTPDTSFIMLSGHTHGGQVTFFGLPIVLPAGSGEYASGFYYKGPDILYVSKGIGNSTIDIRIGADPNIDVLYF